MELFESTSTLILQLNIRIIASVVGVFKCGENNIINVLKKTKGVNVGATTKCDQGYVRNPP